MNACALATKKFPKLSELLTYDTGLRPFSRQCKTFRAIPFKGWKLFAPPYQYGKNYKLPQPSNFLWPPSAWLKLFPPTSTPPFCRGKNFTRPPSRGFVAPVPIISDHSLTEHLSDHLGRQASGFTCLSPKSTWSGQVNA